MIAKGIQVNSSQYIESSGMKDEANKLTEVQ
jgi:hypothetical protein